MRAHLIPHPDTPSTAVTGIEVEVECVGDGFTLSYWVVGDMEAVRWPDPAAPARTDGLWQHTCLELFIQHPGGPGYDEFNFSPSSQWAAYRFTGYRAGMHNLELAAPNIALDLSDDTFLITVELVTPSPVGARAAISAVIEETSGAKSYWAVAHAPGKPDFHHADSFALELP
ncbi:MAG: DOMON-like domain-containing protein [Pseudomonadota bacterium]